MPVDRLRRADYPPGSDPTPVADTAREITSFPASGRADPNCFVTSRIPSGLPITVR